jgi:arsenate reductase-like glutaredoxin family protein
VETAETVNAKKTTLGPPDVPGLLKTVDEVYVAKGKAVVHLDLRKEKPDRATLDKLFLGPTGNLRAPTFRVGRTLVVGFDQATYERLFR